MCQTAREGCATQLHGDDCRPAAFVQPCNWNESQGGDPSLLGQNIYVAPYLPIESTFPTPCPAGFLGSNESEHQASSGCKGPCPAGSFCPTPATMKPEPCDVGCYCPQGSVVPLPCPSGRFTNANGIASEDECTPCPAGSECAAGTSQPRLCLPGSYSGASAPECMQCNEGEYQSDANSTACDACEPGAYCPTGASAVLLCDAGTYGDATDLTAADECATCPAGHACPTGAVVPTACGVGSFAAAGVPTCSRCAEGTYQPATGQSSCVACPAGSACVEGAVAPKMCLAGSYAAASGTPACTPCPAGSYQAETGQLDCTPCPSGHFCLEGASAPLPCPGGTYSRELRLTRPTGCFPVPRNYWAPTGSAEPIACPSSGFFCPGAADMAAHAAANITPAGSQPIPLAVGSVASDPQPFVVEMPSVEIALTLDADLGTPGFDNATLVTKMAQLYGVEEELVQIVEMHGGSIVLLVRIAQESNATLAAAVASVDDAGLSAALGANTTADVVAFVPTNVTLFRIEQTSCAPGHWCTAGSVIPCVVGFYNPNYDADDARACLSCPLHASTPGEASTSLEQCRCEPGYFDSNTTVGGITCDACPEEGVNCSMPGATLERLPLEEEYWRSHELSLQVRQCFEEGACLGGEVVSEYCAPGRRGPYCDVCADGYDKSADGSCYDCADGVSEASIVSMAVLGSVLLLVCVQLLRRRRALAPASAGASVSVASGGDVQEMVEAWLQARFNWLAGLGVKIKILLSLYQVMTTLGVVYDMPRLPMFDGLMDKFNLISLDFVKLTPLGCTFPINYHVSLVMRTAIPLGIALVLSGLNVLSEQRARRLAAIAAQRRSVNSTKAYASARLLSWLGENGVTFSFFLIFLIYPSTSSAILSFFQCFPIDGGSEHLRLDFSIDCNGDAHRAMTFYALAMVLIYPLGVPLLYWATFEVHGKQLRMLQSTEILRGQLQHAEAAEKHHHEQELRHRTYSDDVCSATKSARRGHKRSRSKRLKSPHELTLEARLAALDREEEEGMAALPGYVKKLISGYELRTYHFEIFESLRKLALVGVPVFFTPAGGMAQLSYALLVCFITFGMYTALSPYVDVGENHLAQLCQAQIFFTLVSTIVLKFDKSQLGKVDIVLSTLTFLPITVGLILESPLADCFTSEKMAGAVASVSGVWRRLGARLRSARRWPAKRVVAAERAADAASADKLPSTDLPSALPLPDPQPLARGASGTNERPAVESETLATAGVLGVEMVTPPAEPTAGGPSTESTLISVTLGQAAGEAEPEAAGVQGDELGGPTDGLPPSEPADGPPAEGAAAGADPDSNTRAGGVNEPPSPLKKMSTAVLGFLSDLGRGNQSAERAQAAPEDWICRAPEQMLEPVIAQLRELAGSLDDETLTQLEHDIAGGLLRGKVAHSAAGGGASKPKAGGGEQASLPRSPSASARQADGAVRV